MSAKEIREQLPVCHNCVNCKLIVWSPDAELSKIKSVFRSKNKENREYFTVRCSWLKQPVLEPNQLITCEGKQPHKGE